MRKLLASVALVVAGATAALLKPRRKRLPLSPAPPGRGGKTIELEELALVSRSAQPHKKPRIRAGETPTLDAPAPDSAGEGRTPYYYALGEALLMLRSAAPLRAEFLPQVAARLGGTLAPFGEGAMSFPDVEQSGWYTVLRVVWPGEDDVEASLARFTTLEEAVNGGISWEQAEVASWMPNWLGAIASAERLYTPGGPGSYPRPVATGGPHLPLKATAFLDEWRAAVESPITLAILDAFPSAEALDGAALPPALEPLRETLQALPDQLSVDAARYYATFRTGEPFAMDDHGLMTAWLALEVIGEAAREVVTVLPVRVATRDGICSTADVLAGLIPLIRRAREGEQLVVLLPLTLGLGDIIPPRLRRYEEHYEALRLACLALSELGATLVGASGNDATGLQHPPRTRRPASFRSVIEVTSGMQHQGQLALYANQAKALSLFGGENNLAFESAPNVPALIGPAIAPEQRTSNSATAPNPHGWVAWAGTSFAAALAAGLTVLLRSREPQLKMWEVRTRLRALATDHRHPGNVPFIDLIETTR